MLAITNHTTTAIFLALSTAMTGRTEEAFPYCLGVILTKLVCLY